MSAPPLSGLRIIEFAGLAPAPFAAMMLADHGAEVIRIDRPGAEIDSRDPLCRSRRSVVIDMKSPDGIATIRDLVKTADGLIEGFRPGVMERLGLGPEVLLADNPRLVYGRMTGWGQHGPLADAAGHDINFIAISGVLHTIGTPDKPIPPANYVGDFGGGGLMLAFGMVSAMLAVRGGAPGQVIDAAMTDGAAVLGGFVSALVPRGLWQDRRGANLLDGGAPFYDTYRCADGQWVAIGPMEPQFFALLRAELGLEEDPSFAEQYAVRNWAGMRARLTELFGGRTREEWCERLEGTDCCFAPVLSLVQAPHHPHNVARGTFVRVGEDMQPAPAPRYSAAATVAPAAVTTVGGDTDAVLAELQYDAEKRAALRTKGVLG